MKTRELTTYVLGSVLAVASLVFGVRTDFWGQATDPASTALFSLALAILLSLLTDRVAASSRDDTQFDKVAHLFHDHTSRISKYHPITEFTTSDDAMDYLCQRLPEAKVVLNTKISNDAVAPNRKVGKKYEDAIHKGLRQGLAYKEVVSPGFEAYALELKEYAAHTRGKYENVVAAIVSPCFLNFTVLEFAGGDEELLIGWATSTTFGTEQKAYKIQDKRMIRYFKTYHLSLYGGGQHA